VYEPEENLLGGSTSVGIQADEKAILQLPESYSGKTVHTYFTFTSDDRKLCSMSQYLGEITVI
jgi:hypothetical protein